MSCSDTPLTRRAATRAVILGSAVLAGCGFQPLYGTDAPATRLRGQIVLGQVIRDTLPDRMQFRFKERLRQRLGRTRPDPAYTLDVSLAVNDSGLAITPDGSTTRFNLTGTAAWRLTPTGKAKPALTGTVESFTAYSATATVYATRIARRDAERRLAVDLAEKIAVRLSADANRLVG